ncbi:MAG: aromatic amino acid lyase, partial [Gemmatimonadota bacterium]|nr:aromatic amino acid lyase [Gemmatimonadota bacterium]
MIEITGKGLQLEEVARVARAGESVSGPSQAARERMQASLDWVEEVLGADEPVYGINTGFGALAGTRVAADDASQLSRNVILKCCVGVGDPLPADVVRAMMAIRADTLARGTSGVRPAIVETLVAMLNKGVTPFVPSKGSLGASGDLAPLAHIAVVLTREAGRPEGSVQSGRAWYGGELLTGVEAMR